MRVAATVLCAAVTALVLSPTPALAHDALIASSPEDEQTLDSPPEEVRLTFSGRPMDVSTAVLVLDSESEAVTTTEPLVEEHDVSVELPPEMADGGYAVRWRVVSSDGHPISGSFTFQVGEGGPPPPDLEAAPAAEPDGEDEGDTDAAAAPASAGLPREAVLSLIGALIGLLFYAAYLRFRKTAGRVPRPAGQTVTNETETR